MGHRDPDLHTTARWHLPSQHYGREQSRAGYRAATPSRVIRNPLPRGTKARVLREIRRPLAEDGG